MTATWDVIGGNPAPADAAVIRAVAGQFRTVMENGTTVADRLGSLGSAIGPHLWKGPAADVFVEGVSGLVPAARLVADAHGTAMSALLEFANAVEDAQELATRAVAAAVSAKDDAAAAERDRAAAAADAAAAMVARDQAKDRIAEATALQAGAAADPVYYGELEQYQQQMMMAFSAAQSREDASNQRVAAAETVAGDARRRMDDAIAQTREARRVYEAAVRVIVSRVRGTLPDFGTVGSIFSAVSKAFGVLDLLHDLTERGNRIGTYPKKWQELLKLVRRVHVPDDLLRYKKSPILQFFSRQQRVHHLLENKALRFVGKALGRMSFLVDLGKDGSQLLGHLYNGQYVDALADGKDITASGLKTFGGIPGYLAGYGISVWSDVFTEAKKLDTTGTTWHDVQRFWWESLKEGSVDVGKRMIFTWS